jgi:ATP diphosphatase
MTSRAADLGFDWERDSDVAKKIEEEIEEWRQAAALGDRRAEESEIGDLLLSAVNLARRRSIDPEAALRRTNARFRSRFAGVARRAAVRAPLNEIPLAELDAYGRKPRKKRNEDLSGRPRLGRASPRSPSLGSSVSNTVSVAA